MAKKKIIKRIPLKRAQPTYEEIMNARMRQKFLEEEAQRISQEKYMRWLMQGIID